MSASPTATTPKLPRSFPWRLVVLVGLAVVAAIAFAKVAEEVVEGDADPMDRSISLAIHSIDTPTLDRVMAAVTRLGAAVTLVILVAVLAGYCLYRRERRLALVLAANAAAELLVNAVLKHIVARPRPTLFDEIERPLSYSFPSGHSMASMAIYGTIAAILVVRRPWWRPVAIPTAALLVLAIGFSRVYLGVHWATDVLAGFVAGSPFVIVAAHLARRAPEPAPGETARVTGPASA